MPLREAQCPAQSALSRLPPGLLEFAIGGPWSSQGLAAWARPHGSGGREHWTAAGPLASQWLLRWPGVSTLVMGTYLGAKVGTAEVAIINQRAGHRVQASLSQHPHCLSLPAGKSSKKDKDLVSRPGAKAKKKSSKSMVLGMLNDLVLCDKGT